MGLYREDRRRAETQKRGTIEEQNGRKCERQKVHKNRKRRWAETAETLSVNSTSYGHMARRAQEEGQMHRQSLASSRQRAHLRQVREETMKGWTNKVGVGRAGKDGDTKARGLTRGRTGRVDQGRPKKGSREEEKQGRREKEES